MPLAKLWLCALCTYGVLAAVQRSALGALELVPSILWVLAGALYTHFFEYAYHRYAMHVGFRPLLFAKRSHLEHHRTFHGDHFTARRPEDLEHIASLWFVFPGLFAVHYAVLALVLEGTSLVASANVNDRLKCSR